ncbi:uncharacterized protein F4812DRAFT_82724 [Daldinia caldariorum]|uniref:uncharacterized protein n=1 Tax=Daldinia caldariorum TaxID=326644 RepID=UPI002007FE9E|nr:uncharacterized protein F4812DRAFT_82724 [Daldinia caldariorum]KAI1466541.1 hypothetical protein F4812DRAFT_82724 [Daldinia caldariorum]
MAPTQPEPTYTVFVRLPFPRGGFVDPPPVNWDSSKDEILWDIVSHPSRTEIDWNDIANSFGVTVDFLLQQVTWLTDRHASQVRNQMRRAVAAARSSAQSPQPGPDSPYLAEPMRRTASGDRSVRAPSALSIRKDSALPRNDGSVPGTPMRSTPRPTVARTSSSNTAVVYTVRNLNSSGKAPVKPNIDSQRHRLSSLPIATSVDEEDTQNNNNNNSDNQKTEIPSPVPDDYSDSESSSSSSSPAQSRIIRRPPRFQGTDAAPSSFADDEDDGDDDDDDDDDAGPAFLPYQLQADGSSGAQHDLNATLRGNPSRDFVKRHAAAAAAMGSGRVHRSQTSDSSTNSTAPSAMSNSRTGPGGGPLSPRRTMELAGRSPGAKGKGKGHSKNSDSGTPSIGSSFSDLDDTSVTQSALEEAFASQIQHGTMSNLRGTISAAFRGSRYLPGNSNP